MNALDEGVVTKYVRYNVFFRNQTVGTILDNANKLSAPMEDSKRNKGDGKYRSYGSLHDMLIGLVKDTKFKMADFKKLLKKHKHELKQAEIKDLLSIKKHFKNI